MLHREVYERTAQFEERVSGARLRTYEWQFLASLDGQATVGELVRRLKIDEPTIAEFIAEQERNGAIAQPWRSGNTTAPISSALASAPTPSQLKS